MAAVLLVSAASGVTLPAIGMGAVGVLPLAAALVDAVRMRRRFDAGRADAGDDRDGSPLAVEAGLRDWLDDKAESLAEREQEINTKALALQQWMQFPDAINFSVASPGRDNSPPTGPVPVSDDPMARQSDVEAQAGSGIIVHEGLRG